MRARACYERARDAAERLNADHLLFQAHEALGGLLESAAPEAALDSYRRAVDHLEAVRSRAVATELKVSFLTDKADVYERIVELADSGADRRQHRRGVPVRRAVEVAGAAGRPVGAVRRRGRLAPELGPAGSRSASAISGPS